MKHILLLFWLAANFANAVDTLPQLTQTAFAHNPEVQAARVAWRASIEAIPQAGSLPDPMLRFDYFGESVETRTGPQESRIGLSQTFPFPGTLKQAAEVAARQSRVHELAYQIAVRDMIVALKLSYFELLYIRHAIAITEANGNLLSRIAEFANARDAKIRDRLNAASKQAQLDYDLIALREQEAVELARLNALLNRPAGGPIELVWPQLRTPQLTVAVLESAALSGRQELELAQARVSALEAGVDLALLRNRPSFTVSAMHIDIDSGTDPWMLGVGVNLPIWRDKNVSRVAEAQLHAESADLKAGSLENQTRVAVRAGLYKARNARRLAVLYQNTLLPQAQAAMESAQQWQEGDIAGLLETQSVWQTFNLARLRALVDHQQHLVRLEQIVGGSLPEAP